MITNISKHAISLSEDTPPQLSVVIDTEEEFDWNIPVKRSSTSVKAMNHIHRVQNIFNKYGINPCYVIDYPIASKEEGYQPLLEIYKNNHCEIGAHLHPWVSPPLTEDLKPANTYPGNLDESLEYEKLKVLTDKIAENFGFKPDIYKAGRYGFGPNTQNILKQLGYSIDLSFCPSFNHAIDGGPDYSNAHAEPFWFDDKKKLLEIPLTGAFVGRAGSFSKPVFNFAQAAKSFKIPGIFSKLGIVDRLVLSPEGYSTDEHIKLTEFLYNKGVRTFTWSFHSPAVMPGANPYVSSVRDLNKFLDAFHRYFDFFFTKMNGVATTPTKLKAQLETL